MVHGNQSLFALVPLSLFIYNIIHYVLLILMSVPLYCLTRTKKGSLHKTY